DLHRGGGAGAGGEILGDGSLDARGLLGPAEVVEQQRNRQDGGGRVGLGLPGDVGRAAVHRLEHARVGAGGVDVAAGRQADAAAHRGGQVGDDVAEQVVGDDHVEAARVGHHEDGGRVDVLVGHGDLGELLAHLVHGALPQRAGE